MRYTITKKAARTFSLLIILMIAIGLVSVIEMNNAQNSSRELVEEAQKGVALFQFQTDVAVFFSVVKDYIITGDEKYYEIYKEVETNIEKELIELEQLLSSPEEKKKFLEIKKELRNIQAATPQLLKMAEKNSKDSVEILIQKMGFEFGRDMNTNINEIIKQLHLEAQEANLKAHKERKGAFVFIIIVIIVSVVISIMVVIFTLKNISRPILKLIEIAQRIAARDFKVELQAKSKDEIGMLIIAFNAMAEEIEKRYEELENFSYIAAHDLKSPLNAIIGSAQILLDDLEGKLKEDEEILLRNIVDSGKNMTRLIADLLEFAKAGEVEFSKEPISMSSMLNEIRKDLDFTIKEKNVKLTIQENLPSFICDPVRFAQVWGNLISNAIKYNDKPEPIVEIGIMGNYEHPDKYCFYVKDNGIGIDSEFLDKIFNTFQRATTDKKYEGTGVGLAIVKRIIEFHNGKIWAESTKGVGTSFYFTIPKQLTQE